MIAPGAFVESAAKLLGDFHEVSDRLGQPVQLGDN